MEIKYKNNKLHKSVKTPKTILKNGLLPNIVMKYY